MLFCINWDIYDRSYIFIVSVWYNLAIMSFGTDGSNFGYDWYAEGTKKCECPSDFVNCPEKLVKTVESNLNENGISQDVVNAIRYYNRSQDPVHHQNIFKIIDMVRNELYSPDPVSVFCESIIDEAKWEIDYSPTYLQKIKWQDLLDSRYIFDSRVEGAIEGLVGGASNEYRCIFSCLDQSYHARLAMGVFEGNLIANPFLPIAPGYWGYYENGKIVKCYREPADLKEKAEEVVEQVAKDSSALDDETYQKINTPIDSNKPGFDEGNHSQTLSNLPPYDHESTATADMPFYDLRRVSTANLGAVATLDLMARNIKLLQAQSNSGRHFDTTEEVPQEEIRQLLFPGTTAEEEKSKLYEQYLILTGIEVRVKIEQDFGFKMSEIDFWHQRAFLSYLERATPKEAERLQEFCKEYGADGIRAFLICDKDEKAGEQILDIGSGDIGKARQIFAELTKLAESAQNIGQYLNSYFSRRDQIDRPQIALMVDDFIAKGAELVGRSREGDDRLLHNLQQADSGLILFSTAFKRLKEANPDINFEDFASLRLETSSGAAIAPDIKQKMIEIFRANWSEKPEIMERILPDFEHALQDETNTFYLLVHKDGEESDIVGFFRLDPQQDGCFYAGSLNINSVARSKHIGEEFVGRVFGEATEGKTVIATADTTIAMAHRYIGEFGFVADGLIGDYGGSGCDFFHLRKEPGLGQRFQYFGRSYKSLLPESAGNTYQIGDQAILLHFEVPADRSKMRENELFQRFLSETRAILDQQDTKYYLTAYVAEPKDNSTISIICGFERAN